jgi:hypothetical protein
MLLRFRKNSTSTTEPSGSVAVAVKFAVDAVWAAVGTPLLMLTDGASPWRLLTTTVRETGLVPCAPVPIFAWVLNENVPGVVGTQIAR